MNELVETHPRSRILAASPRTICTTMLALIVRLAERGPVQVLDCGHQFNAYQIAWQVRGRFDMVDVKRYQILFFRAVETLIKPIQMHFGIIDLLAQYPLFSNTKTGTFAPACGQHPSTKDGLSNKSIVDVHHAIILTYPKPSL